MEFDLPFSWWVQHAMQAKSLEDLFSALTTSGPLRLESAYEVVLSALALLSFGVLESR